MALLIDHHLEVRLSVALCTWNRADSLARTLESLAALQPPECAWEMLLVDNNSSDNTRSVAEAFVDRLPLRYVFEPLQGLSAARNRAIREFSGSVLIFTDDDVIVSRNWLREIEAAWNRWPDAGFIGGRVLPFYPAGRPRWLQDESLALLEGVLVRHDLGASARPYRNEDPLPVGANFGLSRACIADVGAFRLDLGVSGGSIGRGEETDVLERARRRRWTGIYVGEAHVEHETDPRRLRVRYLLRYGVQSGLAAARTGAARPRPGTLQRQASFALRGAWQLVKGRGDRARQCLINIGLEHGLALAAREREGR